MKKRMEFSVEQYIINSFVSEKTLHKFDNSSDYFCEEKILIMVKEIFYPSVYVFFRILFDNDAQQNSFTSVEKLQRTLYHHH